MGREKFREALLKRRTEEEWSQSRVITNAFYSERYSLEGRDVNGRQLVETYERTFPADRVYNLLVNQKMRMFAECEVPQFRFSEPDNLRGFLLSVKSVPQWREYEPSPDDFNHTRFQFSGVKVKGQMLAFHFCAENFNRINGTYYTTNDFIDGNVPGDSAVSYLTNSILLKIFKTAGLQVRGKDLSEVRINKKTLIEILLSAKTEGEWRSWDGGATEFAQIRFAPELYRRFSGGILVERCNKGRKRSLGYEELFDLAGLEVGTDPEIEKRWFEDHFNEFHSVFESPREIRNLLLQAQEESEWKKPQNLEKLRKMRVTTDDRSITLHTLMHHYSAYKYNRDNGTHLTMGDMQANPELEHSLKINTDTMKELAELSGFKINFTQNITDLDLTDPILLRRLFFNGRMNGVPLSIEKIVEDIDSNTFRKARFIDQNSGVEVSGHTLMCYYSGQLYADEHPEVSRNDAVFKLKKARSSKKVMLDLLKRAGLVSR